MTRNAEDKRFFERNDEFAETGILDPRLQVGTRVQADRRDHLVRVEKNYQAPGQLVGWMRFRKRYPFFEDERHHVIHDGIIVGARTKWSGVRHPGWIDEPGWMTNCRFHRVYLVSDGLRANPLPFLAEDLEIIK